jgi:hypothetical protein
MNNDYGLVSGCDVTHLPDVMSPLHCLAANSPFGVHFGLYVTAARICDVWKQDSANSNLEILIVICLQEAYFHSRHT